MQMPLTRRGPNPFGMRQYQMQNNVTVEDIEQVDDNFKIYPLTPGDNPKINTNPYGVRPVQPLRPQPYMSPPPQRTPMIPLPQQTLNQQPMAQVPPETAADQFRKINQGLPDGVRYEPLDEETMRLLKEHKHIPDIPEPEQTLEQPPTPPPTPPTKLETILTDLAKNETEAQQRYKTLAENATNDEVKKLLHLISADCEIRHKHFTALLQG